MQRCSTLLYSIVSKTVERALQIVEKIQSGVGEPDVAAIMPDNHCFFIGVTPDNLDLTGIEHRCEHWAINLDI
jgi:hypothetical protein